MKGAASEARVCLVAWCVNGHGVKLTCSKFCKVNSALDLKRLQVYAITLKAGSSKVQRCALSVSK